MTRLDPIFIFAYLVFAAIVLAFVQRGFAGWSKAVMWGSAVATLLIVGWRLA